eukprot:Nitzschia sp. Nitz4//scaffold8_size234185//186865//190455//NITZ4_001288-RA/size234185-augustus-gene-0.276-mRNA-1//-1//CDS//3329559899//5714//frame0
MDNPNHSSRIRRCNSLPCKVHTQVSLLPARLRTNTNPYVGSFRHSPPTTFGSMKASLRRNQAQHLYFSSSNEIRDSPYLGWFHHAPKVSLPTYKVDLGELALLERWRLLAAMLATLRPDSTPPHWSQRINGRLLGGGPTYKCYDGSMTITPSPYSSSIHSRQSWTKLLTKLGDWLLSPVPYDSDFGTDDYHTPKFLHQDRRDADDSDSDSDDEDDPSRDDDDDDDSVALSDLGGPVQAKPSKPENVSVSQIAEAYYAHQVIDQSDYSELEGDRLDYVITQADIARMARNAARHLDVDSILRLPTVTYRSPKSMIKAQGRPSKESIYSDDVWSFVMVPTEDKVMDSSSFEHTDGSDTVCVICLEAFKDGDRLRVLPCDHSFHVGCIDRWLSGSHSHHECFTSGCPTCKKHPHVPTPVERRPSQTQTHTTDSNDGSLPSWAFSNLGSQMAQSLTWMRWRISWRVGSAITNLIAIRSSEHNSCHSPSHFQYRVPFHTTITIIIMSTRFGVGLSRYCRRKIGLGWMTTLAVTAPTATARWASTTPGPLGSTLQVAESLNSRLHEPEMVRVPRPMKAQATTHSKSEEKRLRSDLASELCRGYGSLPPLKLPLDETCERGDFLIYLATGCSPKTNTVAEKLSQLPTELHNIDIASLRKVSTPEYEELLEFVVKQDAVKGMEFLIELREDLQRLVRWMQTKAKDDERLVNLKDLDAYLLRMFSLWFSPGMIELKRITFEQSPASVIEFVATREAVHPMRSLNDLRSRLGPGRRVLALFHKLLKDTPLVFVHVALTDDIPGGMPEVLELTPMEKPTCATFYSITNAIPGLAGVGLGEHLIKEAVGSLQKEFSSLQTFVTLSPMPRFRKWVEDKLHQNEEAGHFVDESILSASDMELLEKTGIISEDKSWTGILNAIGNVNTEQLQAIKPVMVKLAARYIVMEKHRGKPLDGVARFHLGNGAYVHRLNHAADLSRKGIKNSYGMMVNYRYDLDLIKENQREFETSFEIHASDEVWSWIKEESEK